MLQSLFLIVRGIASVWLWWLCCVDSVCLPVAPLVARLDAIELTDPLLIDTDDCWLWLRAEDGLGRVCWLPKWTSAEDCPPP